MAGQTRPAGGYRPGPESPSTPGPARRIRYSTLIVPRMPNVACMLWVQRSS
jgi:hypothetical protein